MADNLIFPVKFDLEAAVREAQGDADRLLRRLQTTINAKPLAVNLKIPGAGSGSINEINSRLKELVKQWNNLTEAQRITNKTTGEYTAEAKKILAEYTRLRGASESYAQSLKQIDSAAKKAAKQQEKLAEAAYRGSNAFKNQDGYVSRLIKRLAVYASFQYTSQFLTNIREVTAQFELQRISLGAIIQDQQKANQIFAEIKSFALTSPLKILDLTKYAKQVAAYGFAADRVFDVTKRLADISVGLGVDMGRLTLAVSQIKAATVLKSSELRQLTETGLPMLDLLSKKLTETQGKLVSAADVMDLISKRAISYEMVEEILYDLTDAGGMFYNMQVKQSQTLFGMWSKLGDAAAVMYDQIGNTGSINVGMKLAIRSIEQMMRNWKTTARVLDTVAVATTVYVVGLKNAAVASRALTTAEATKLAIMNKQIIATPKLIASIFGHNAATRISTTLTKAHTAAMIRQYAATNVLSKGFWELTAAMLANPWVAAAAGVALVATALFHFIGNTETAAERAEKLNESVAALKNTESTTKPLVEAYTELSNKTERTVEEQKKLSNVTQELAKRFPEAVVGVNKFNNEITISIGKVQKLAGLMKDVSEKNVRNNLEKSEADLEMLQNLLVKYDSFLKRGGGSFYDADKGATVFGFWLSESDKKKIVARMAEITGQIETLNNDIINTKRELGDLPSEEVEAIEGFGAWKKKLTEFSKDVGGIKVKLFDDSTINQFGTLEEALDAAAKKNKEATESVEIYNKTLERGVAGLGQEQFDKIAAERDEAQAMKELSEEALNYYNAMALLLKVMGGGRSGQSDPRLSILREMASTLKQVNKEYDELAKKEGATKALSDTQDKYANTFKYLQSLATKYKFELPNFGVPTDAASLTKYLDAVKDAMKKLPESEKAVLSLETDIADINMADAQKKIEAELKRLSDRISRTKTAKEFYEKILGMTGDIQLSANLTVSVYGQNGQDLQDAIREQIRTAFETDPERGVTIDLSEAIDPDTGVINYNKLAELEEKYKDVLIDGRADLRKKLIEEGRKSSAAQAQQWLKDIEKAKDFAQQRIDLATYTANQIAAINARTDLPQADKEKLIKGYQDREAKQLAKLQYDEFKDSAMYVHIFEDLDHASTTALKNMRDRLIALKGQWKNLDPTQVKELTKAIADLDAQIAGRSPFKSILDGFKGLAAARPQKVIDAEMIAATDELARREETLAAATRKLTEAQTAQVNAQAEVAQARQNLEDALAVSGGEETAEVKTAREILGIKIATFNAVKTASKDSIAAAKTEVDEAADKYEEQKKVIDKLVEEGKLREANIKKIELANQKIDEYQQQINEALGGIRKMMEAFGASGEDMQFFDDVVGSLNEIMDAGQQAAMSVASFMSGNILGGITSGVSAIGGLVSGFTNLFSAGKVRKANKEIKRQQELLEQLEYTNGRLEASADKVFGRDYLNNYNQQLKNLRAQQSAYLKQAEAERSKGKKADENRIKEYENQARETADRIKELEADLSAHFTGTSRTDAARQMAKSWIDARASMSDTFAAIKGDYADMIKNMIVEGAAARVIENALSPVWDSMEKMLAKNDVQGAIDSLIGGMDSALNAANNGMEVLWKALEARGYDMKKLIGDTDSEYTGIAKNIAGATSEEINTAAAIGNTLMYYVSPIPRIDENLARVVALMEGKTAALPTASGGTVGTIDYTEMFTTANQHLSSLPRMEQHLAEIYQLLGRALKTKGSTTGFNTFLNS